MQGTVSLRSVHGKFLSAQPDGRAEWNRDIALEWELFNVEPRTGGKIALKGIHGMYVSAQPDGTMQINRIAAPPGGWEEFTVEERGNNVICLKSYHGKYLSAQQDGTAQWNRDHAPPGGWEDIQIVSQAFFLVNGALQAFWSGSISFRQLVFSAFEFSGLSAYFPTDAPATAHQRR